MPGARSHSTLAGRRGAIAIEYALILPALLMFVLGIVDMSRLLWTYTTLYRATEAAARCAAINTTDCGTSANVQSYAVSQAFGMQIAASAFNVTTPACGVQVNGSYDFTFTVAAFVTALGPVTLKATACYPWAPSGGGGSSSGGGSSGGGGSGGGGGED
jgi:Flp pilus assembly protein TadG